MGAAGGSRAALVMMLGTAAWFDLASIRRGARRVGASLARNAASELQLAEQHYLNAITALEKLTSRETARSTRGRRGNRAEPAVDRSRDRPTVVPR